MTNLDDLDPDEYRNMVAAGARAIRDEYGFFRAHHDPTFAEDVAEVVLRAALKNQEAA